MAWSTYWVTTDETEGPSVSLGVQNRDDLRSEGVRVRWSMHMASTKLGKTRKDEACLAAVVRSGKQNSEVGLEEGPRTEWRWTCGSGSHQCTMGPGS